MSLFADDRVLVGVVKRRKDLRLLLEKRLYRIPVAAMPAGVESEVLAFFVSGAVYYYAVLRGVEMARRRDIVPDEPHHQRADQVYWLCQTSQVLETHPPIMNSTGRRFAFIHTTWDRFADAMTIDELYSQSRFYVRRYDPYRDSSRKSLPYRTEEVSLEY